MSDARVWTLLLAAVSFLAGTAAGLLLADRRDAPQREGWALYADELIEDFDLSPERASCLRVLLDSYDAKLAVIQTQHRAATRAAMEPEIRKLAEEFDRTLRNRVLPPDQRDRYDRMTRPVALVGTEPR